MTDTNRYTTRRHILQLTGTALTTGFVGCLGEDDPESADNGPSNETVNEPANESENESTDDGQPYTGPDIDMGERPFKYIAAPEELADRGLTDKSVEGLRQVGASYRNSAKVRDRLTDEAWQEYGVEFYPRPMLAVKYDLDEPIEPDDISFDDVVEVVNGKGTEGLIRTTVNYQDLRAHMESRGFDRIGGRNDWTIFDGAYKSPQGEADMRFALNGSFVAYVSDEKFHAADETSTSYDLTEFMEFYTHLLFENRSLSFSETSEVGRDAERVFHNLGDRDWTGVGQSAVGDDILIPNKAADDSLPADYVVNLVYHDGREMITQRYVVFENGDTQLDDPRRYDVIDATRLDNE